MSTVTNQVKRIHAEAKREPDPRAAKREETLHHPFSDKNQRPQDAKPQQSQEARELKTALELRHVGTEYGQKRAELLSQEKVDHKQVQQLDKSFQKQLESRKETFLDQNSQAGFEGAIKKSHDRVRALLIGRNVERQGLEESLDYTRRLNEDMARSSNSKLDQYLSQNKEFLQNNPSLAKAIASLQRQTISMARHLWFNANREATALYHALHPRVGDPDQIIARLTSRNGIEMQSLITAYNSRYNLDLQTELRQRLPKTHANLATHLILGDKINAAADRLHLALSREPIDEQAIRNLLKSHRQHELLQIEKQFNSIYANSAAQQKLEALLASRLSGAGYAEITSLKTQNEARLVAIALKEQLLALQNSNDPSLREQIQNSIYNMLSARDSLGLAAISQEFSKAHGSNLGANLAQTFKGLERDKALALLAGNQLAADAAGFEKNLERGRIELNNRLSQQDSFAFSLDGLSVSQLWVQQQQLYESERTHKTARITDFFSKEGEILDREVELARRRHQLIRNKTAWDENDEEDMGMLISLQKNTLKAYRKDKQKIIKELSNTAGVVLGLLVFAISSKSGAPFEASAPLSIMAGLIARSKLKSSLLTQIEREEEKKKKKTEASGKRTLRSNKKA